MTKHIAIAEKRSTMEPHVTIAIPVAGNSRDGFQMAVRSVFAQTHTHWRLLIVLDGASAEIAQLATTINDERVRVIDDGLRCGLAARLNQIAEEAATEYLFRMDADDVMRMRRVEVQLKRLRETDESTIVASRAIQIDENAAPLGLLREANLDENQMGAAGAFAITHPTVAARTRWFRDNPYDESIARAEDKELWLRAGERSRAVRIDEPLLYYRIPRPFNRAKSLATLHDDRVVLRRFEQKWSRRRVQLETRSLLRQLVIATVGPALWPLAYRRKFHPATSTELDGYRNELTTIRCTHVPGWPGARVSQTKGADAE
ncbi:hypothetical protein GCM10011331_22350 [Flavimobilis marinus]|uniref:Glycosyltransferase involved in cell wall bisynthesis n=1 Tax=Flavimobilis marinus TaxID=285351 RepID=A0A1I2GTP0_9MICO|nr:glycosyltransferase family 2 protein [Flavimobilis marinus]GHG55574.1 hypothetical protein GCM10011331_22350 [Flavimobilis marinus]SFF20006.1 Glycosyltransferase involved in cell wall bisynthesis [Flavimobilis marinus]